MTDTPRPADHPHRAATVDELHARPFPSIEAPTHAWFVALRPERRIERDRAAERAQLDRLIQGACQTPPEEDATHWSGRLGPLNLKWESHTEFVTILIWGSEESDVTALAQRVLADGPGCAWPRLGSASAGSRTTPRRWRSSGPIMRPTAWPHRACWTIPP